MQDTVESLYIYVKIVKALMLNSNNYVPQVKPRFYQPCWNDTRPDLKRTYIAAHDMWEACHYPRFGDTFL